MLTKDNNEEERENRMEIINKAITRKWREIKKKM